MNTSPRTTPVLIPFFSPPKAVLHSCTRINPSSRTTTPLLRRLPLELLGSHEWKAPLRNKNQLSTPSYLWVDVVKVPAQRLHVCLVQDVSWGSSGRWRRRLCWWRGQRRRQWCSVLGGSCRRWGWGSCWILGVRLFLCGQQLLKVSSEPEASALQSICTILYTDNASPVVW